MFCPISGLRNNFGLLGLEEVFPGQSGKFLVQTRKCDANTYADVIMILTKNNVIGQWNR